MTREEFARRICWSAIVWTVGLVNVGAMLPQLMQLVRERQTDGLNIWTFVVYLMVQVTLALDGYFKRNGMLLWCMGLSAVVTTTIIVFITWLRYAN